MKKPHSLSVALRTVTAILILCSSDALFGQEKSKSPYLPTVFGLLKSRFEADTQQGKVRFNIPNARVGVKGSISPYFKYQFQVDLNTDGKVSVLDTYGTFVANGQRIAPDAPVKLPPRSSIYLREAATTVYLELESW